MVIGGWGILIIFDTILSINFVYGGLIIVWILGTYSEVCLIISGFLINKGFYSIIFFLIPILEGDGTKC